MTTKHKYKSDAFEAIHSAAVGMRKAGTIGNAKLRNFDESCLGTSLAKRESFKPKCT